jgi:hypothetical protein
MHHLVSRCVGQLNVEVQLAVDEVAEVRHVVREVVLLEELHESREVHQVTGVLIYSTFVPDRLK